jgi:hypothetical protein
LRSPPTPLASNQLIAISHRSHHDWLNNSAGLNGARQLIQSFFAKSRAWLVGTWLDQVNVNL